MLAAIRRFAERHFGAEGSASAGTDPFHPVQVAAAALLVETIRVDSEITDSERDAIRSALAEKFGLAPSEAAELVAAADEEARAATDYFQFTAEINRRFSAEQKIALIEFMWRSAFADGTLHDHELHLIRKVAELIHVPHREFIAAKLRVRGAV